MSNKLTTFSRTFLRGMEVNSQQQISGMRITSMEYKPEGHGNRILVVDVLKEGEKVRLTALDPDIVAKLSGEECPAVVGYVRHDIKHQDEVCDDLVVLEVISMGAKWAS